MLITHILIALSGLLLSALSAITPSKGLLKASGVAIVMTLASGTALVLTTHSSLSSACLNGLAYLAVTALMDYFGWRRLSAKSA